MRKLKWIFCLVVNVGFGVMIILSFGIANHDSNAKRQTLHRRPVFFLRKIYDSVKLASNSSLSEKSTNLKIAPQTNFMKHQDEEKIKSLVLGTTKKPKNHSEHILSTEESKKGPLVVESKDKVAKKDGGKSILKKQDEKNQSAKENVSKKQIDKKNTESTSKAEPVKSIQKHSKNSPLKQIISHHLNKTKAPGKNKSFSRLQKHGSSHSPHDGDKKILQGKNKKFLVPNIVHYVWLDGKRDLRFHEVLCVLSAQKYLKPDVIKIHCDKEPTGIWWDMYKEKITSLKIVYMSSKVTINGIEPGFAETKSDVARIRIVQKEGGIYLDFDVMVIQSFDDLRKYEFTLGLEYYGNPGRINNGIIIAAPNARFFKIWLDSYKDFKRHEWDDHSCIGPYLLAPKYPSLIHVDENRLNYPDGKQINKIYYENYNWKRNYAMHLWFRMYIYSNPKIAEFNPDNIRTLNSTFGQLARRTLYNTPKMISDEGEILGK